MVRDVQKIKEWDLFCEFIMLSYCILSTDVVISERPVYIFPKKKYDPDVDVLG